jgi:cytochrome c553
MTASPRSRRLVALGVLFGVAVGIWGSQPAQMRWPAQAGSAIAQDAYATAQASPGEEPQGLAPYGVCIGCHSPAGGPPLSGTLTGRWLSPNITPDPVSGIGAWSRDDLFSYFRHGRAPGRGQAGGPMAPVVEALQDSSDADIHALIDWLLRQPGHRDPLDRIPASERGERLTIDPALMRNVASGTPDPAQLGAALYNAACASCHGADGAGSPDGKFPSMFRNSSVGRRTLYNLVAALLRGVERRVGGDAVLMQSFDGIRSVPGGLSDDQLAALSNFVIARFGDLSAATITREQIERSRLAWWGSGEPTSARGQLIAVGGGPGGAAAACFGCHGLKGQGDAGSGSPRLAGLDVSYFAKQMGDYSSGSRPHGAMSAIAEQLSEVDRHALALYYAALPAEPPAEPTVPVTAPERSVVQAGERLYARGAPERGIQACTVCHGPAGHGFNPIYPSLAQPESYTAAQLRLWRERTRRNDPHDLMGAVSRRMTDEDIRAASAYLARLAP